ncbi:MAG: hypothetical protein JRD93_10260, partial [Deltaproteobacteria bacterium]|nr:hypothetical protein [Deltaproteobacteria bacterium]
AGVGNVFRNTLNAYPVTGSLKKWEEISKKKGRYRENCHRGKDSGIIDLVLVENVDQYHLNDLSRKTERYIKKKICSLLLSQNEYERI